MNYLTFLIFAPLVTAILIPVLNLSLHISRLLALLSSLAVSAATIMLLGDFAAHGGIQFEEKISWIPSYGINYHLGVDGYSLAIMLLIAVLIPVTFIYMLNRAKRGMFIAMLFAQGGATGALFSLDLILFYLFWETMLLPIFIMIGLYGLSQKEKVALRITLYTIFGSMTMLFAILLFGVLYYEHNGSWSFDILKLSTLHNSVAIPQWLFWCFLLAFAIKIPLLGFHGWLKSAYESSPIPTLIILSGIMAKLGVYTIYRFIFLLFPFQVEEAAPYIIYLGLLGMLYFGLTALLQKELRFLFAYSSASHMSLIVVGLFTLNIYGQSGSLYLIMAHALATGGLFLILGIIDEKSSTLTIDDHSGIIHVTPWLGALFALFALSIVGIPASSGFIAELLIIIGSFKENVIIGFITATTLLIAMTFVLWMMQRMLFGTTSSHSARLKEISLKDGLSLSLLALLIYLMGIYPDPFLSLFQDTFNLSLLAFRGDL